MLSVKNSPTNDSMIARDIKFCGNTPTSEEHRSIKPINKYDKLIVLFFEAI